MNCKGKKHQNAQTDKVLIKFKTNAGEAKITKCFIPYKL